MRSVQLLFLCALLLLCAAPAQSQPEQTYRSVRQKVAFIAPSGWTIVERDKVLDERDGILFSAKDTSNPHRQMSLTWRDETRSGVGDFLTGYQIMRSVNPENFGGELISEKIITVSIGGMEFARANFRLKTETPQFAAILMGNIRGNIYKFSLNSDEEDELNGLVTELNQCILFDPAWMSAKATATPWNQFKRTLLSEKEVNTYLLKSPAAKYPQAALGQRLQGYVVLHIVVGTDGNVKYIWLRNGDPLLNQEAVEAVAKWKFKPYLWNGEAYEMECNVSINFRLK